MQAFTWQTPAWQVVLGSRQSALVAQPASAGNGPNVAGQTGGPPVELREVELAPLLALLGEVPPVDEAVPSLVVTPLELALVVLRLPVVVSPPVEPVLAVDAPTEEARPPSGSAAA